MKRINTNHSASTILNRYSAYTLARLRGDSNLAGVAGIAQNGHDSLRHAIDVHWNAMQETMAADSVRDVQKYQLDVAFRGVRLAILGAVHNNRQSALYTTAFPDGFSDAIRGNATEELREARGILTKLAEVQMPGIPEAVERLREAVNDLCTAVAGSQAARALEKDAADNLQAEKGRYARTYEEIYCRLVMTLGEWRLAETYFRKVRRSETTRRDAAAGPEAATGLREVPRVGFATASPSVSVVAASGPAMVPATAVALVGSAPAEFLFVAAPGLARERGAAEFTHNLAEMGPKARGNSDRGWSPDEEAGTAAGR